MIKKKKKNIVTLLTNSLKLKANIFSNSNHQVFEYVYYLSVAMEIFFLNIANVY